MNIRKNKKGIIQFLLFVFAISMNPESAREICEILVDVYFKQLVVCEKKIVLKNNDKTQRQVKFCNQNTFL